MKARSIARIHKGGMIITVIQGWLEAYCDGLEDVEGVVILGPTGRPRPVARRTPPGIPASEEVLHAAQFAVRSEQPAVKPNSTPRGQLTSLPLRKEAVILRAAVPLSFSGADPNGALSLIKSLPHSAEFYFHDCAIQRNGIIG